MATSSSSSSALAARQALASRLGEIRNDAGFTGRELARRCGWHPAKASRIANGNTSPSEDDIKAWCAACGADDEVPELIAARRAVEGMWVEWRRMMRAGLRPVQAGMLPLYERTQHFRAYSSWLIPGMIQTRGYAEAVLRTFQQREHLIDDVAAATEARLERQKLLHHGVRRFAFLIEESVLRYAVADADTMAVQLGHLLTLGSSANVSLGILPMRANRGHWAIEDFWTFDDALVRVELLTGELTVSQPAEVARYVQMFTRLAQEAAYGAAARTIIASAVAALS
jgi:hypothetical protein